MHANVDSFRQQNRANAADVLGQETNLFAIITRQVGGNPSDWRRDRLVFP